MKLLSVFNFKSFLGFVLSISLIFITFLLFFGEIPIYDYEGFSFRKIVVILSNAFLLFYILNYENSTTSITDNPKPSTFKTILLFAVFFVGIFCLVKGIKYVDRELKYQLPLSSIKTSVLEGTLSKEVTVNHHGISYLKLEEYPDILFKYVKDKKLKNRITSSKSNYTIIEGSKVQIKIREHLLKDIKQNSISKQYKNRSYSERYYPYYEEYSVPFYSFSHQDIILFEKMYLK